MSLLHVELSDRIWIVFTVLGLFSIVLLNFLIAVFVLPADTTAKTILGVTDATLGASLRAIIAYLIPKPKD